MSHIAQETVDDFRERTRNFGRTIRGMTAQRSYGAEWGDVVGTLKRAGLGYAVQLPSRYEGACTGYIYDLKNPSRIAPANLVDRELDNAHLEGVTGSLFSIAQPASFRQGADVISDYNRSRRPTASAHDPSQALDARAAAGPDAYAKHRYEPPSKQMAVDLKRKMESYDLVAQFGRTNPQVLERMPKYTLARVLVESHEIAMSKPKNDPAAKNVLAYLADRDRQEQAARNRTMGPAPTRTPAPAPEPGYGRR